ncbi:hypothetical protein Ciccas_003958 [Cichlidogyrus casuarinus]|uniref:Uncharacterized protein n=1 Tax=Cichlidogyrus casuarinus TaxID=1844966 RepID=A0ABD2QCX8_9PLAT
MKKLMAQASATPPHTHEEGNRSPISPVCKTASVDKLTNGAESAPKLPIKVSDTPQVKNLASQLPQMQRIKVRGLSRNVIKVSVRIRIDQSF